MSDLNVSDNFLKIIDSEEDIKDSPHPFENMDEFSYFNNSRDEFHSSYTIPERSNSPLFINNENFINYFMHIDYNTPLNEQKSLNISQSSSATPPKETNDSNCINKNETLSKKTKREKEYGIITDNLTGITYLEKEDPINYRKAKKRIQNRESALRMKKIRESNNLRIDEEINKLKEDNIRLINENVSLKKEKMFLIDQIKFMQKIIKESNLEFKLKNSNEDNKKYKEPILYYDGSKQKIKGKLFNVFMVCILSIVYICGECSYESEKAYDGQSEINQHSIHLNSVNKKDNIKNTSIIWFYLSKIIIVIIFFFIIPLLKDIFIQIKELIETRNKKKYI